MTIRAGSLPRELAFRADWPSPPVVCAARVPSGWLLAGSQHGVVCGAARLERDARDERALQAAAVRVLGAGEDATRVVAATDVLPDGRALLAMRGDALASGATGNAYLDTATLESASAGADLAAALDPLRPEPTSHEYRFAAVANACTFGDRLLLGQRRELHELAAGRLVALPASSGLAGGPARIWAPDFVQQGRARGASLAKWSIERFAALEGVVLLAGQTVLRSGSSDHALLAIGAGEVLVAWRPDARERIRADDLRVVADHARGLFVVCGGGRLELLDAELATAGQARDGHPFLTAHRLLCGDGEGGLLWYAPATGTLVWSAPEDLTPADLDGGLDRLAAAASASRAGAPESKAAPKPKPPKPAKPPKPLVPARPVIDAATFRPVEAKLRQQMVALVAKPPAADRELHGLRTSAETLVAYASVLNPEDPIVAEAVRWVGQAGAALFQASVPGGPAKVDVRIGDGTATLNATRPQANTTHHGDWIASWYAALVARDAASLDVLAAVPDGAFWPNPVDDFFVAWRDALRAARAAPASAREWAERAIAACVRERFQHAHAATMLATHAPTLPLLPALLAGDGTAFRAALVAALSAHAKHWGAASRRNDPRGWVAWGPMAMCCAAADQGLEIDVSSDYLLPHLIARR